MDTKTPPPATPIPATANPVTSFFERHITMLLWIGIAAVALLIVLVALNWYVLLKVSLIEQNTDPLVVREPEPAAEEEVSAKEIKEYSESEMREIMTQLRPDEKVKTSADLKTLAQNSSASADPTPVQTEEEFEVAATALLNQLR